MSKAGFTVRALGEVVLRTGRLDKMRAFYRDMIGLGVMRIFEDGMTFFRLAPGFEGHTAVLALFPLDRGEGWNGHDRPRSTLHHFALGIPHTERPAALAALAARGLEPWTAYHEWVGWHSIYVRDPDGNTVELVSAPEPGWVGQEPEADSPATAIS